MLSWVLPGLVVRAAAAQPAPASSQREPPPPAVFEQRSESASEPEPARPPPPPPPRRDGVPAPSPKNAEKPPAPAPPSAPPPAPAPVARGAFVHDGFYLRLSLGGSYGRISVQTDRVSQPDVTQTGFGGAVDLWGGYTVSQGLVVGPALSIGSQRTSSASVGSERKSSATGGSVVLSGFIDAYPNPRRGEHFGGLLGLATLKQTTDDGQSATDYEGGGLGLHVFAGYDAWIARQWSLGALLRLGGVVTRASQTIGSEKVDKQGVSYEAALLVSVLHH